jgi:spoIIIJ-associated protein
MTPDDRDDITGGPVTEDMADEAVERAGDVVTPEAGRDPAAGTGGDVALLEREGDIAADYLEALLDIADLDGDIDIDVEGSRAAVSIVGAELTTLVGADGETLEALQELTRLAVHRETGVRSRLMLDIGGHRARRRDELTALGRAKAEEVRDGGETLRLDPMTPFERKVVHDAVAAVDGVVSESEGEEPQRRIVIRRG